VIWFQDSKPTGAMALLRAAVDLGRERQLPHALIIPLINTTGFGKNRDLPIAVEAAREALELVQQVGARDLTGGVVGNLIIALWLAGEWDEAEGLYTEHEAEIALTGLYDVVPPHAVINLIRRERGQPIVVMAEFAPENDPLTEFWVGVERGLEATSAGDDATASRLLSKGIDLALAAALIDDDLMIGWPLAVELALATGDLEEADRLVAMVADFPPGLIHPLAHVHLLRARAMVNRAREADSALVDEDLSAAIDALRAFGTPFYLATALLERGSNEDVEEAHAIFERLGATPWMERAQAALVGS